MRLKTIATLTGFAVAATGIAAHADGIVAPARKPGLWTQTMAMGGGKTMVSSICIDRSVDQRISAFGQQMSHQTCSKNMILPFPGGWKFESVCTMKGMGTITSSGTASGDFSRRYTVKSRSTTAGASMAAMNGTHDMTVVAAWAGPCPAGMAAGDMTMPGGMKINILKMGGK